MGGGVKKKTEVSNDQSKVMFITRKEKNLSKKTGNKFVEKMNSINYLRLWISDEYMKRPTTELSRVTDGLLERRK